MSVAVPCPSRDIFGMHDIYHLSASGEHILVDGSLQDQKLIFPHSAAAGSVTKLPRKKEKEKIAP